MTELPEAFLRVPIAHRALHDVERGRPENSRAAIAAAIDHGYGIEIDLQPSRDREAMVFHDYQLDRLTGRQGAIRDLDATMLSGTLLDNGVDETIPTLPEVLAQVEGRIPVLIELKDQHGQMGASDGVLEEATVHALKGYSGPVAVMSFNPNMVDRLSALLPNVPRGLVTCGYPVKDWPELSEDDRALLREIPDYERVGACFVSHQITDLDNPRLSELKKKGADILCWTVRSPKQAADARQIAANITFEGFLPPLGA